ncbi:hypothetical protein BGZ52_010141, partial [Haplosporangium bisporale]
PCGQGCRHACGSHANSLQSQSHHELHRGDQATRPETSTTIPQCLPSAVRRGFAFHVCQPKKESSLLGQDDAHRHSGRPLDHSALTDLPATDPSPHPGDVSKSQR